VGQSQNPISSTTQQLNQLVSAVVDVNGAATFTFQSPPSGQTWTGTLQCPGAPATAIFAATIGATQWCDWAGNSIGGPVQCFGDGAQQLVVTGSGLSPGATNEMVWIGSSDTETLTQPVWPDPNTSAQTVQFGSGTLVLNQNATISSGAGAWSVKVPPTTRTLICKWAPASGGEAIPTVIGIAGASTSFTYYNQPPYLLQITPGDFMVIVPIIGVADTTLAISVGGMTGASLYNLTVWADTAEYDESILYNGPVTTVQAGGVVTLVNGPCRLLALSMNGAAGGGDIQRNVPAAAGLLSVTSAVGAALSFGSQGIIIPYGDYVSCDVPAPGVASVTYAYP